MKCTIAAIGRAKSNCPEMKMAQDYLKRLPWECQFKETEEKRQLPPEKLKEKEASLLLSIAPKDAVKIILDENGKTMDSQAFASQLERYQDEGRQQVCFFIGGAFGHGDELKQQADLMLSFGKMTWPHLMVRTMLAEQLYRAYTILNNHPYHKI